MADPIVTPPLSTFNNSIDSSLVLYNITSGHVSVGNQSESLHLSPVSQTLLTGFYIVGAGANLFSLALMCHGEQARNRKLILMIRCLASNDLMALSSSGFLLYLRLYLEPKYLATQWYCGLRVLTRLFGFSSGSVASVMAIERFIALTRPFFYQKYITHKLIKQAIFLLWFIVLTLVLLPLVGFGLYYEMDSTNGLCVCVRYRYASKVKDVVYAYLVFGFGTTMCLVIVSCNLAVVRALCRMGPGNMARCSSITTTDGEINFSHATQEERAFAKLMVVLCVFFVICWLPQMLSIIIVQTLPRVKGHPLFRVADVCTALNFLLDPVVYVLSRRPHRRGMRRLLKPLCQQCWEHPDLSSCTGSNSQGIELSKR